ncbi:hypothetical protein CCACVL1_24965, partial [Corchorus capsularis]
MASDFSSPKEIWEKCPLDLAVDKDFMDSKIISFGFTMGYQSVVRAKPINNMNVILFKDQVFLPRDRV